MEAKHSFQKLGVALGIIAFGSLLAILVSFAAWNPPTVAPTGGNAEAPLNVGGSGQSKVAGLILNTGAAPDGLVVRFGNVGIGTPAPAQLLDVAGEATFNNNLVHGVATPIDGLDAVNKDYVDAAGGGTGPVTFYGISRQALTIGFPPPGSGLPACNTIGPEWVSVIDGYGPHASVDVYVPPSDPDKEEIEYVSTSVCSFSPSITVGNVGFGSAAPPPLTPTDKDISACKRTSGALPVPFDDYTCNVCRVCIVP